MRTIIFIVTFVLAFGGVSVAGAPDNLPNAGLFVFHANPAIADASIVLASR
jgi:hypothetical protein